MSEGPISAAVDWGTTSFRLWLLDASGRVLAERRGDEGLLAVGRNGFEAVLEAHLAAAGAPPGLPVVMCGMVGSRTGWLEAPYLDAPAALDRLTDGAAAIPSATRRILVLPGIAQRSAGEPDVMRGEETQLLGVVAGGRRSGLVCLPGTHSKWVLLNDGAVEAFSTFMTGEIFQLLRASSVLTPAVEGAAAVDGEAAAFAAAVRAVLEEPGLATNRLFQLRAGWLLEARSAASALARLSGTLIGLEIAGARERYGALSDVTLVASGPVAPLYAAALRCAGAEPAATLDAEDCVRRGLFAAASAFVREGHGA